MFLRQTWTILTESYDFASLVKYWNFYVLTLLVLGLVVRLGNDR